MRYSQEFKDNVVARLLSKELSISEAVERYSIGKSTISYWLKIAREQAVCGCLLVDILFFGIFILAVSRSVECGIEHFGLS